MKKLTLCAGIILLLAGPAVAQQKASRVRTIVLQVERRVAQKQTENLKPYYPDAATAQVCELWHSCAKWAVEQYAQDPTFKVSKAQLITQHKVYRHRYAKETHLFVEAIYQNRTVRLEFTTPNISGRGKPYNYISKFPQNKPR